MMLVDKKACGVSFKVEDPGTYPFEQTEFETELATKEKYWSSLGPSDVVMDLGAAWGGWTMPALAQGAYVIAVEPSAISRPVLRRNAEANGWDHQLEIVSAMLWGHDPVPEDFYRVIFGFGGSRDVAIQTLDQLSSECVEIPTRVKFDVEGAEVEILRGGHEALKRWGYPMLIVEVHDDPAGRLRGELLAELALLGYSIEDAGRDNGSNPFVIATR
jgi:FkbM family methyltransferase